jgi:hypothetical protein
MGVQRSPVRLVFPACFRIRVVAFMQRSSVEATWVDDRGRAGYAFRAMSGRLWRYAISEGVPKRSLIVALVIGTILNLINQGNALIGGAALDVTKLLLTYVVPYCVSTYGAVSYRLHAAQAASGPPPLPPGPSVHR